jgi:putative ABC transport system substrate-binding protein
VTRRALGILLLALVALSPTLSKGEQATKVFHIGFLRPDAPDFLLDAFREGLRDLGYIEGKNIVIEPRWASGHYDEVPALADELVRMNVDIIVTSATPGAMAAKRATNTIPIVIASSADPVASGIVASLAHPGGNITGLTLMNDELAIKRLEILKETVPRISRVAVLWSTSNPTYARMIEKIKAAAPLIKFQVEVVKVASPEGLDQALSEVKKSHVDSIFVFEDPVFRANSARIVKFAARNRLSAVYGGSEFVHDGGLMSYGPSHADMFRRAAGYVDRILRGAKPGDLPIEQPTKFELVVNLKTAKALGITIPQSILLRADEVIR